jgi:cytochrome c5
MKHQFLIMLALSIFLVACSDNDRAQSPVVPEFSEARLVEGRAVWMNVCRNCHLMGVAGAPAITDHAAWAPRQAKGNEALYESALEGIRKDGAWTMPPRGGNPALSDNQIRTAVDFMLAAVDELKPD